MPAAIKSINSHQIALTGALNFDTVPGLQKQLMKLLPAMDAIAVDLSQVSFCDSSGVALLLECLRLAKKANKSIRFLQMPAQMQAIAGVSGVTELLSNHIHEQRTTQNHS